ncbi:MAG: response regulator [Lachnospiraceae bacterium]|nr:response regulator [Lachnospiraceae bacterium]
MSQYSVLLVDDEEEVYQVIMKKLDWENLGFHIAGYAKNGVEALEMAEEMQIDVVMTDIKMPYMDGLTLCKKLKELYQKIKVIIFSGFDEFEYAKEAIKAEVEEYILKPIDANELGEVFTRIKINLDKELDEKRNIDKLREYYLESLPVLQENFYTSLVDGRIPEDVIEKYARSYQIELAGPYYVITVLHISVTNSQEENMDPFLLAVAVKQLAEEQLAEIYDSRITTYLGDIIVITQLPDESITRYTDVMDKFCKMAKRVCKAQVTAGIGHVCNALSQLQLSYQGAKNAVSYRVLYGNTRAISIGEMDPQENADIPWEEPYIYKILKKIKMGEEEPLQEAIQEFIRQLSGSKMSLQKYRILIMELITEIFRFGANNQLNLENIFGEDNDVYTQAMQLESPEALKQWLNDNCLKMQRQVVHERQDTTKSFVTKAMEYVKEHYADQDLGIEQICSYLNVSAAYFSTVFKKETGKTFINYLTEYRMEQALDLLLTKNEKTYIIADKVGYSDPNYFSYVFKKQFGMSPSKYKTSKMEQN